MNREEVSKLIPILQAFVDEKEIRRKYGTELVNDGDQFHLDQEYIIKPEPRELWIPGNDEGWMKRNAMTNEEKEKADWGNSWIKVREVIE